MTARKKPLFVTTVAHADSDPFRLLVDAVKDYGIFLTDPAGLVSSWNSGAELSKGYAADEIIGQHFSVFYTADDLAAGAPQVGLDAALALGRFEVEGRRVRRSGEVFWAIVTITTIHDAFGQHVGFANVTRDITERRQAEDALRLSEAAFRDMANAVPMVIWVTDITGGCTFVNEQWTTWTGQSLEEARGFGWMARVHPDDREGAAARFTIANNAERAFRDEFRLQRQTGEYASVVSFAQPSLAATGAFRGYVGCVLDMTEQKLLEKKLSQAQKMEAFGQLAGGVAHDFNNLLTVISGYSDLVLDMIGPDDPKHQSLVEISEASQRAASLTRQLLSFSRLTLLEPVVLDVNVLVTNASTLLRRTIGEDVLLTTLLAPNIGWVKVDPGQMEQVLMNLVINARDAMPHGGAVTIETSSVELDAAYTALHLDAVPPGRYVSLTVSDNGCGMTPDVQARVFEPFFTTKAPGRGTGLGLATVHGIVKQSAGHVSVYTEPGNGTVFTIYLPVVDDADVPATTVRGDSTVTGGRESILLVEDDDAVRGIALLALQAQGYDVSHAESGMKAREISRARPRPIDLLLTDVVMPGVSGPELAGQLRLAHPGLKVLYVSGYTDDAVIRHGILQADVAFLQKPYTPVSLARKVREVLDAP